MVAPVVAVRGGKGNETDRPRQWPEGHRPLLRHVVFEKLFQRNRVTNGEIKT